MTTAGGALTFFAVNVKIHANRVFALQWSNAQNTLASVPSVGFRGEKRRFFTL